MKKILITAGSVLLLFSPELHAQLYVPTGSPLTYGAGTRVGVGPGITTPTNMLHIKTTSPNDGLKIEQVGNTGTTGSAALHLWHSNATYSGHNWSLLSTNNGNTQGAGKLLFYDYSAPVGSNLRMLIDASGYVGIGLSTPWLANPKARLHVNDGSIKLTGTDPVHGATNIFWGGTHNVSTDGEWALEYNTNLYGYAGLNFWRPNGSHDGTGAVQATQNNILFLGNNNRVGIRTNNTTKADFTVYGNMLIGDPGYVNTNTAHPYGLYVQHGILTSKLKVANVNSADWADFVFAPDYKLQPLDSVNAFIQTNRHLPGVPSAEQVEQDGVDVVAMDAILLQQIEELWLHMIRLQAELDATKAELEETKEK
jgi:hypothetical protein